MKRLHLQIDTKRFDLLARPTQVEILETFEDGSQEKRCVEGVEACARAISGARDRFYEQAQR